MSEGLVTPKRTTARFLPGSPRQRYKAELAMVKDSKKKEPEPTEKEEKELPEKKEPEEDEDAEKGTGETEEEEDPSRSLKRPAASAFPKQKAKAKAKGKATGKGKGKAKAKAKTKAADKKGEKDKSKDTMKKPAAVKKGQKGPSFKEALQKLGEGVSLGQKEQEEGEEEEEKEQDPLVDPEEKRSKAKGMKFARMKKLGQVPKNIQEMYEKCDGRKQKTKLLNRLFEKNPRTGHWEMRVDKPEFQAFLKSQDMRYGEANTQSYPRISIRTKWPWMRRWPMVRFTLSRVAAGLSTASTCWQRATERPRSPTWN